MRIKVTTCYCMVPVYFLIYLQALAAGSSPMEHRYMGHRRRIFEKIPNIHTHVMCAEKDDVNLSLVI